MLSAVPRPADVLIVGGGPAGRALAGECARRGLDTVLLDPAPARPWQATYGMWSAELPGSLPPSVVAARARGRAVAVTSHGLGWEYAVLDVPALRAHLDAGLDGVRIHTGRAVAGRDGVVTLADGGELRARVVVDAGGRAQPLGRIEPSRNVAAAEQTAYGIVVDERVAAPVVAPGDALFMDWRPDHGEAGWPTFLYAIPLGSGRVLLEETSLARRPGLPLAVLRRRLLARLARHGSTPPSDAETEKVTFPVDRPHHPGPAFGAAAPLVHPATGFSLAASLRLAPAVAEALVTGRDVRSVVWTPAARAVHRFRRIGLEALLRMPPTEVPAFFELFFSLPERHRWSYLTGRDDLTGTAATMASLFLRSSWTLRRRLVLPALRPPLRSNA